MRSQQNIIQAAIPAVIYARFSSHKQHEESIEQQVAECEAYAATNGFKIVGIYSDSAKTGRTDRRADFQRLQRDSKKGKFQAIIAYKSNRIARNMLNAMVFENDMERIGISVLYAKEEFGNNAAGRFALRTMMNVNQFFSENMGEDIKRSQADNAQNCLANGPASYGFKTDDEGHFIINEDEASIIREIAKRLDNGEVLSEIERDFDKRGIKTRRGNRWTVSSLYRVIQNKRIAGYYIFNDIEIKGGVPAIIDEEVWIRLQQGFKKKFPRGKKTKDDEYLLTGKLFCGECGDHMIGMSGTGKSGTVHYYYVCSNKRGGGSCKKKNVRREYIESEIARGIKEYVLQPDVISWMADSVIEYQNSCKDNPDYKRLKDELTDVKKSLKNLVSAIEQGIFSPATKTRLDELETRQCEIKAQLKNYENEAFSVTREQIIAYFESFKDGDIDDKDFQKTLFDSFVTKIYLFDDRVKIIFDFTDSKYREVDFSLSDASISEDVGVRLSSHLGHQKTKETAKAVSFCFLTPCLGSTQRRVENNIV
ncbi:MAG: recombinase family protein [Ruminococcaceae bacterium]|nr:recombinase family protein [Oscillospiraceae bacterium]